MAQPENAQDVDVTLLVTVNPMLLVTSTATEAPIAMMNPIE
jgi:hypothetical protein